MHTSRQPDATGHTGRFHRTTHWLARRRHALLSSALRGAAYATGAGVVGLIFWRFEQRW